MGKRYRRILVIINHPDSTEAMILRDILYVHADREPNRSAYGSLYVRKNFAKYNRATTFTLEDKDGQRMTFNTDEYQLGRVMFNKKFVSAPLADLNH